MTDCATCIDTQVNTLFNGTQDLSLYAKTYTFEKKCDFGGNVDEIFFPKVVLWVSEQLNEGDKGTPGMRTVDDEAFQ
jgi:hypothetical protein